MNTQHPTPEDPAGPDGSGADSSPEQGAGPTSSPASASNPTEPLPRPAGDSSSSDSRAEGEPGAEPDSGYHPGQPGGAGPAAPTPPGPSTMPPPQQDFFTWVRSRGIQRGPNRWVGGVSSGIAARMGIDPIIVRGLFIVLTLFAGIGVLLYGIGWALLPEPDGRIHVQEAGAGHWSGGMTGALITTLLGFGGLGGGFWGGGRGFGGFLWACFWLGIIVLVVYLLVDRGRRRTDGASYAGVSGTTSYGAPDYSGYGTGAAASTTPATAPYTAPYPTAYASAYAPAGDAPYTTPYTGAAYAPGPSGTPPRQPTPPAKPRPSGPGAPAVAITAGIALLVGGGLKLLDAANMINLGDSPNAVVWAAAAAVLGIGIVLAGARGKTSGLLGFFAVIALLVGAAFNIAHHNNRFNFDDVAWSPTTLQEATRGYDVTGARGTIDLTDLDLDAPLGSAVEVPLDITASNITVIIPDDVPVRISADMTMGNIQERGSDRGGISTRESSYNTALPGSALVVSIDGTFSNVTIQEGN